jgi:hypothetical protein
MWMVATVADAVIHRAVVERPRELANGIDRGRAGHPAGPVSEAARAVSDPGRVSSLQTPTHRTRYHLHPCLRIGSLRSAAVLSMAAIAVPDSSSNPALRCCP